ncbi:hypothetical protein [Pedobacter sp. SYP-B3415]|uniref:hypothetical protein n=1 Tax=Pedobacter sp. SYP-B3415 TaxID=2496641 RepID=UPI00101C4617|nr:hypothetical protein [Pedobacter sp. SYP-B3415]
MKVYQFKDLTVKIYSDHHYNRNSADNQYAYLREYIGGETDQHDTICCGISLMKDLIIESNCILVSSGGATAVTSTSSAMNENELLVCCGDSVFCLEIPSLNLLWMKKCDLITCFQIFHYDGDYIIHGETQITRLNSHGDTVWEFIGGDIFVNLENDSFDMTNDNIILLDFSGESYTIGFDGQLIT